MTGLRPLLCVINLAPAGILTHDNEAAFSGARFVPVCSRRCRPEMCDRATGAARSFHESHNFCANVTSGIGAWHEGPAATVPGRTTVSPARCGHRCATAEEPDPSIRRTLPDALAASRRG